MICDWSRGPIPHLVCLSAFAMPPTFRHAGQMEDCVRQYLAIKYDNYEKRAGIDVIYTVPRSIARLPIEPLESKVAEFLPNTKFFRTRVETHYHNYPEFRCCFLRRSTTMGKLVCAAAVVTFRPKEHPFYASFFSPAGINARCTATIGKRDSGFLAFEEGFEVVSAARRFGDGCRAVIEYRPSGTQWKLYAIFDEQSRLDETGIENLGDRIPNSP